MRLEESRLMESQRDQIGIHRGFKDKTNAFVGARHATAGDEQNAFRFVHEIRAPLEGRAIDCINDV